MVSGGYNDNHPGTHWLYGMYVTPAARGSGAAELLVEAVVDWARERRRARDLPARRLRCPAGPRLLSEERFHLDGRALHDGERPSNVTHVHHDQVDRETSFEWSRGRRDLHELRRRVLRENDATKSVDEPRDAEPPRCTSPDSWTIESS